MPRLTMLLQQEILLRPTKAQKPMLNSLSGYARWTGNTLRGMLLASVGVYDEKAWDKDALDSHLRANIAYFPLVRDLRSELAGQRPEWAKRHRQYTYNAAAENLSTAMKRFLDCDAGRHDWHKPGSCGFPSKRRRARHNSFEPCNTHSEKLRIHAQRIEIPGIGEVRMSQPLRETCWVKRVVIKLRGNRWFASVLYENGKQLPEPGSNPGGIVGVDVGIKELAVCSDGRVFHNPAPLQYALDQLRRLDRYIAWSRRENGNEVTHRCHKLYERRRRLHERISDIRRNAARSAASAIAKTARVVVVESLTLTGLLQNRHLSRALSDAGLGFLLAEIKWQCAKRGVILIEAPRSFASTQLCARCGRRPQRRLSLSVRVYRCGHCGWVCDRDLNSSLNLEQYGIAQLGAPYPPSISSTRLDNAPQARQRRHKRGSPLDDQGQVALFPGFVSQGIIADYAKSSQI